MKFETAIPSHLASYPSRKKMYTFVSTLQYEEGEKKCCKSNQIIKKKHPTSVFVKSNHDAQLHP